MNAENTLVVDKQNLKILLENKCQMTEKLKMKKLNARKISTSSNMIQDKGNCT